MARPLSRLSIYCKFDKSGSQNTLRDCYEIFWCFYEIIAILMSSHHTMYFWLPEHLLPNAYSRVADFTILRLA